MITHFHHRKSSQGIELGTFSSKLNHSATDPRIKIILYFLDDLLSKHGGSGTQDGGLYGKAEDDDLERYMATPVRPSSSKINNGTPTGNAKYLNY